jgi:hypothetical protein
MLDTTEPWTRINAPDMYSSAVVFEEPVGGESDSSSIIKGFRLRQFNDFGDATVWGANPEAIIDSCRVFHIGPADNWFIPVIYLRNGGIVRNCEIENRAESNVIESGAPGAYMLVEDCIFDWGGYPWGLTGGSGSVTIFKNNTFDTSGIVTDVIWGFPTDFTWVFINNIINGVSCQDHTPPDSLEFRHNDAWPYPWPPDPECAPGPGNFFADPLFCDEIEEDFRLEPESPCLGAGENGEDIGARIGVCWDPAAVGGERGRGGGQGLLAPEPNPSSGPVKLSWEGDAGRDVEVDVLDVRGRLVRRLSGAGHGPILWDGRDAGGREVPGGIYFLRVLTGGRRAAGRVVMVR